jgi:uncharacterized membrane protein HdeD (DUF308 family)
MCWRKRIAMKPWIHPQERRSRIFWWVQITIGVIALIVGPIFLLREPTRDHLIIAAALVLIGGSALFLSIRVMRKLPEEYRYEAEEEDSNNDPR